uniref:E3 ubiquitin-protein ligase brl1 n=1 Tax=Lygus hesperus TaxID=30085 RepID=A0A0A9Y422_LYGHE
MVGDSLKLTALLVLGVFEVSAFGSDVIQLMVKQVGSELKQVDVVMVEIKKLSVPPQAPSLGYWFSSYMPRATPGLNQQKIDKIFDVSANLMSDLAIFQVRLISQRNGPQGDLIDKTLSRIEEKTYQLKTMLIQLQQDKSTPVTYFPKEGERQGQVPIQRPTYRVPPNPMYRQFYL